ncbi:MAG: fumarylacetoacetate hydrolase family protein [Beutenbergiaceae bacterium]
MRTPGGPRTAVIGVHEVAVLPAASPSPDDVVRDPRALAAIETAASGAPRVAVDAVELLIPLTRFPRDVLCTGWNYWDHYQESAGKREGQDPAERPRHPTFFTKGPGSLIGPRDPIAFDPALSGKWDYEAELAIVIGKGGRSIPADRALEHVVGALVANDISQRDLQRRHGGQWLKGKTSDAGSPIGPWLTTMADVGDLQNLDISCSLNGRTLQSANTGQMAFSIAEVISELSWGMTLNPGDVILTGTPSGIGNAREPQIFLSDGDRLVTRVAGLGELTNTVTATDLTGYWTPGAH